MKDRKIVIKPELKELKPILREWFNLVEKYCRAYKGQDAPYWYNERASLSALAGAIWRKGGIVLEEFSSKKVVKKLSYSGRTDFWFRWKDKNFTIEAKFFFHSISPRSQNLERKLFRNFKTTEKDVEAASLEGEKQIALVFITPYIPKTWTKEGDQINQRIIEFTDKFEILAKKSDADIHGWFFPIGVRNLIYEKDKSVCPGMAFVVKYLGIKKA